MRFSTHDSEFNLIGPPAAADRLPPKLDSADTLHVEWNPLLDWCELAGRMSPVEDHALRFGTAERTRQPWIGGSALAG